MTSDPANQLPNSVSVPDVPVSDKTSILPIPGELTAKLGSGEHARNSIAYSVISWSFWCAAGTSAVVALADCLRGGDADVVASIKDVWTVFIPLITLAIGYVFGRSPS